MKPSKCKGCNALILWKRVDDRSIPYNAKRYGDEFIMTDKVHWDTCPNRVVYSSCAACKVEKMGDINLIHKINIKRPLCTRHAAQGYLEIPGWNKIERYPTEDLYHLRKTLLSAEKKEEKKMEKLAEAGLGKHPLDEFVYGDMK